MKREKLYPLIGERINVVGSYSEVMMHFQLAGRPIQISLEYQTGWKDGVEYPITDSPPMCQVWKDGRKFSGLITLGEGGYVRDPVGWYCYPDDGPGDADPKAVQAEITEMIRSCFEGVPHTVITNLGL